ncbi:hypothetical protein HMPREF3151_03755 [Corynebacterium sp. HMSC05H05]|uniref:hypothetical protein n=1 Tax=unclassified Corynebacterium TaxID=2624378 RepID=UPI0008A365BE|nr:MULTISPECIES: hypothetical protein [unclassified Corynebacterium]OFT58605.1 hypothetical protein HMPREF3151_03755 [Corynebacterium sp. HMSC05H05]OHR21060.1 hypothetical protein HMPREF2791_08775 [Corynebacterium sp. HMSC034A01]
MSHRTRRPKAALTAAALAAALALSACADAEMGEDTISSTQVTAAEDAPQGQADDRIGVQRKPFEVNEADPLVSDKTNGERVEDPAMELSYKWQGTSYAPNGGSVVVVAITNESDAPLPEDALEPTLRYNVNSTSNPDMKDAKFVPVAEEAGVDIVGLDRPLGPGATVNAKYPFDVTTGNLWDAEFTIGNVTFKGNLNN